MGVREEYALFVFVWELLDNVKIVKHGNTAALQLLNYVVYSLKFGLYTSVGGFGKKCDFYCFRIYNIISPFSFMNIQIL